MIDSRAFSDFCGIDSSNQVPDGDTLGRFRNLLIKNGLQEKLFSQVVAALMERGLILKKGTIVDSTIISTPSSTKNKEKKRDPDAHQVKKGNTWHFGYMRSFPILPSGCPSGCECTVFDPLLTQNGIGTGSSGRKQRKIHPPNSVKQRKTEPKWLRFFFGTTYGPEGRGFESLTACQKDPKP